MTEKPKLSTCACVYITANAATEYARFERIADIERARRELTELMLDATAQTEPGKFRMRKRSTGLDITARVEMVGRLAIVVGVHTRDVNTTSVDRRNIARLDKRRNDHDD